nr:isocitrate dehydrogenase [NAD] regulatory subunit 3, mitochondrial-like [Tanacetum cinerariifolium]
MADKKIATTLALFISSPMMLRYLQLADYADHLETARKHVIYEGKYHTKDLRGSTTIKEATDARNVGEPKMADKKIATNLALFISSPMMLRYLQLADYADHLETARKHVIYEGKYHTKDLRGNMVLKPLLVWVSFMYESRTQEGVFIFNMKISQAYSSAQTLRVPSVPIKEDSLVEDVSLVKRKTTKRRQQS